MKISMSNILTFNRMSDKIKAELTKEPETSQTCYA